MNVFLTLTFSDRISLLICAPCWHSCVDWERDPFQCCDGCVEVTHAIFHQGQNEEEVGMVPYCLPHFPMQFLQ